LKTSHRHLVTKPRCGLSGEQRARHARPSRRIRRSETSGSPARRRCGSRAAARDGTGDRCRLGREGDRHHHERRPRPAASAVREAGGGETRPLPADDGPPQASTGQARVERVQAGEATRRESPRQGPPASGRTRPGSGRRPSSATTMRSPSRTSSRDSSSRPPWQGRQLTLRSGPPREP
jgi:hypothetical protein